NDDEDEDALAILRKRIDLVPLDDQAHIDLLRALTARGHFAEAEHHLATTVNLYQREGLDPKALYEARFAARRIRGTFTRDPRRPASTTVLAGGGSAHGDKSDRAGDPPGCLPTRRASIVVMPFAALPSTERGLADALTYDIIVGLAKLRSLLVIAQGTTFA